MQFVEHCGHRKRFFTRVLESKLEIFGTLFSKNAKMQSIFRAARDYSDTVLPVLISGERGSGKRSLALEMHCVINPAHKFEELQNGFCDFESLKNKTGWMAFIEELDELSEIQIVSLKDYLFWQKQSLSGARIIVATRYALENLDPSLKYLMGKISFALVPLRERRDDIVPLIDYYISKYSHDKKDISFLSAELLSRLLDYDWPLNVAELVDEMNYLCRKYAEHSELTLDFCSSKISGNNTQVVAIAKSFPLLSEAVEQLERSLILNMLVKTNWNKSKTSRELGISRSGLIQKVEKYGLVPNAS